MGTDRRLPVFAALLLGSALVAAAGATPQAAPAAIAAARDAVYPSLVNIAVVAQSYGDGRAVRYASAGSGVIVSPSGHVLTNYHVAGDGVRLTCTLIDGRVREAAVVAHDPLTDLSVLRLAANPGGEPYPAAALGDSDALAVGDPVLAMGNPLALSSSVTLGIVANPRRVFTDFSGNVEDMQLGAGEPTGLLTRWIQHDALILPGNSGGPLVDLAGRVVGINELGGGFGFAIPSNIAAGVLAQALAHGEVRRGWLGLAVLPVAKLGRERGALVSSVLAGSPAAKAGVAAGDLLLALAGEPVDARFVEEVPLVYQRIAALAAGERVALALERDGRPLAVEAVVEPMPAVRGAEGELAPLGISALEITPALALARGLGVTQGLWVTGVRPGSPAEQARPELARGDVLTALDGLPVASLSAARERLAATPDGESEAAERTLVTYRRGKAELATVVRRTREPRRRWGGELPVAWLGVETQVLTPDLAQALGAPGRSGFRVTEVLPGTAAATAGLTVGDLLVALDGDRLAASRPQDREDLRRTLEARSVGDAVRFTVLRGNEERTVAVTLEARPVDPAEADRLRQDELGFAVREPSFRDRAEAVHPPLGDGVLVVEVAPGGWAQVAGLALGDRILELDGRPVGDLAKFQEAVAALLASRPAVVAVFVQRGPRTHFVFLEPDWTQVEAGAAGEGESS